MFNLYNYLQKINCPSCNSTSYSVLKSSNYVSIKDFRDLLSIYKSSSHSIMIDQLVECNICDFSYLNPRIKSEIILQSYSDNLDEKHVSQDKSRYITFKKSIQKIFTKLNISEITNKTFLDIGSASGIFLKLIKDIGFIESGYEPSHWMVNYGKQKYGVNINQGFINNIDDIKYDYISFWDVLEHVTDLKGTLEKTQKLSKKNTYLIINVPDIDSFISRFMKFKWPFYLNVHLYYFKKKTLESILNKYDFEHILNFPHLQYLQLGYLFERAGKYFSFFLILKKISDFIKISKISVPYNMGQTTFIFKKKND